MVTELLMAVVVAGNGVAAGVFAGTLLGGVPLLMALPPDRYVHAHRFLSTRYDPFMPVTLALTALLDLGLAFFGPEPGRPVFGLARLLLIAVMTVSVTRTVPINRWIGTLDPERLPADWDQRDPRASWNTWNRVRSGLAIAALFVNVAAVVTA